MRAIGVTFSSIIDCYDFIEWLKSQTAADEFFSKGLAQSTIRTYSAGVKKYMTYCTRVGKAPLPTSEDLISGFVAMLAKDKLSYASIRTYLSAIRYHQIACGHGDPGIFQMPRLEYVLKGVRKDEAHNKAARRGRDRQPLTPRILKQLFEVWKRHPVIRDTKMLWAATCLAFFGFLRVGEFTSPASTTFDKDVHLSLSDVSVDSASAPSMLFVRLKQSKTDQLRQGVTIVLGKTEQFPLCPLSAMLSYLVVRGRSAGPLFMWKNGLFLTRENFVAAVRKALEAAGLDTSDFNGHSFRIGAATTAASRGMEDCMIKTLGRWESDAYQRYIRIPRQELAYYTKILANQGGVR